METVLKDSFQITESIHDQQCLNYQVDTFSNGSLFITLESDSSSLNVEIALKENSHLKVFLYNKADKNVDLDIKVLLGRDSTCKMGVLDIQDAPLKWKQYVELQEEGAEFEIYSGQLCMANQDKICDMEVRHVAGHTIGEIHNFAVLSDEGQYQMVANGNIEKNCAEAQSHQATRVLTLGKNHKAKVIPLLLIDENEVKASHALTIGQPDEDQLYYLQSRGLTTKQAIGLLSVGYFLPVLDLIDNQELHDTIRVEMESKVGLYGHPED